MRMVGESHVKPVVGDAQAKRDTPTRPHDIPDPAQSYADYTTRRLGSFIRAQLVTGIAVYLAAWAGHLFIEAPTVGPLWLMLPVAGMFATTLATWRTRVSGLLATACLVYIAFAEAGVYINALSWTDGITMALPMFVLIPLIASTTLALGWDFSIASAIMLAAPALLVLTHEVPRSLRIYYAIYMATGLIISVVANVFAVRFYRKNFRLERQLRAYADIDELTQLPRRRRVIELAKRIIHRCERANLPVCVLYLDADRFKSINDIFGHDAGDRALTLIASQIQEAIRPADVAGRFGGEEFIVFLPGADLHLGSRIAERLRKRIEGIRDFEAVLSVSIGVAQHIKGHDIHHVIQAADGALLHAKRTGRNRVTLADTPMRVQGVSPAYAEHEAENTTRENERDASA
jgi:diguanylate cyclase (GGDEF)-like protein